MSEKAQKVLTLFWPHSQASFGIKIQANTRNWSQWNYHTKPVVELPLAAGGIAAVPWLFCNFYAFAASFSTFK